MDLREAAEMFDTAAGLWSVVAIGTLLLVGLMALLSAANKPRSEESIIGGAVAHLRITRTRQARRDLLRNYLAQLPSAESKNALRLLAGKIETAHAIRHAYGLKTVSGRQRHLAQVVAELQADPVDDEQQATELLLLMTAHDRADDHNFWAGLMEGLEHGEDEGQAG